MEKLSQSFLDSCTRSQGRIFRGENMTRLDTFVDAAFAFALTMLIISIDDIPSSPAELLELSKDLPAFLFSAVLIAMIWDSHAGWSRNFGMQDGLTTCMSIGLVILVLVFIYPIKLIFMSMFSFLSDGYLSPGFEINEFVELRSMFIYFALLYIFVSLLFIALYQHALRNADTLLLTDFEKRNCKEKSLVWLVYCVTAFFSVVLALSLPATYLSLAGFLYASLFISQPMVARLYGRVNPVSDQIEQG